MWLKGKNFHVENFSQLPVSASISFKMLLILVKRLKI